MSEPEEQPGKKKPNKKPWYKHPSTLISLGAMLIALISAATSVIQANTGQQQTTADEQQELVTLVTDIANDPATTAQQSLAFEGNQSEENQAAAAGEFTELADSEEAVNLIGLLHSKGVTATDYYETALGLESGDSFAQALQLFAKAVNLPSDPRTHASILRDEAQIYYELGRVSQAERSDALAERTFNNAPDVTVADQENNVAYTEFFDAWYQATINCSVAFAEATAAEDTFAANVTTMFEGTTNEYANTAEHLQKAGCVGSETGDSTLPAPTASLGSSVTAGTWVGSFVCQQGVTGLRLVIASTSRGALTATFDFYPLPDNPNIPSGIFAMTGESAAGRVLLTPDYWISQPSGYNMVTLSGAQPANSGQVLSGTVTGVGCTTFSVQKL